MVSAVPLADMVLLSDSRKTASNGMFGLIYAGRGIAGFGIGSVSLLVPVYIAETSPPSIRGRLIGIFEILSQGGGMVSADERDPSARRSILIVPSLGFGSIML